MAEALTQRIILSLLEHFGEVAAQLDPVLAVSYPDVAFTPVLVDVGDGTMRQEPYLSVNVLPNTSDRSGLAFDSELRDAGLLAVNAVWPAGQGVPGAVGLAAQVADAFAPGTSIVRNGVEVKVFEQPRIAPPIPGDGTSTTPVTIRWVAWSNPGA